MGRVKVIEDGSKVFSNVVVMLLADCDGRVLELGGRVVERLDAVVSGLLAGSNKNNILRTTNASGMATCPKNYLNPLDDGPVEHKCIADEPEGDHDNPVAKIYCSHMLTERRTVHV